MTRRLCLLLLLVPALASADRLFGPYLQIPDATTALVCVATAPEDTLRVRLWSGDTSREATASGGTPACATFTGLAPDIAYQYEARVNDDPPLSGSFVTGAAMPAVAILGDTRSGEDSFDLNHAQVVEAIRETLVPDAVIHTGDFVERGDDLDQWRGYFHLEADLLAGAPLYPAVGQSDQPPDLMRRLFPLLAARPWYSFDLGPLHFAVLDIWQSNRQSREEIAVDGAQATWLRADLAAARARGARLLFVVMQEAPFDAQGRPTAAAGYAAIYKTFGVSAVFSGAHYFSHTVRDGVNYFTNGGGGAVLDALEPAPGVYRFFRPVHHFLFLDASAGHTRVRAVDTRGDAFYEVEFEGGSEVDPHAAAATFSEGEGAHSLSATIYFRPGLDDLQPWRDALRRAAPSANATVLVTLLSLDDSTNRAAWEDAAGEVSPPVLLVGGRIVPTPDQVGPALADAARDSARDTRTDRARLWLVVAVALAAAVLTLAAARAWRRRG